MSLNPWSVPSIARTVPPRFSCGLDALMCPFPQWGKGAALRYLFVALSKQHFIRRQTYRHCAAPEWPLAVTLPETLSCQEPATPGQQAAVGDGDKVAADGTQSVVIQPGSTVPF